MKQVKTLIGLAGMLGLLAISAAPALASWESNNGTSKGSSQLKEGTNMSFQDSAESLEIKCPAVSDEWTISQQEKLSVSSTFEKCIIEALMLKFPVAVSGCSLQLEQGKGAFTAITNLITPCTFVIQIKPSCTVVLPLQGNHKLSSTELTNVGKNVEALANLSGISVEYPATTSENPENRKTCRDFLGANSGTGGIFKATTIEHELKAV